MQNIDEVQRVVKKKLRLVSVVRIITICMALATWILLDYYLKTNPCSFVCFVTMLLLGGIILEALAVKGWLGVLVTSIGDSFLGLDYAGMVGLGLIYYAIYMFIGVKPSKLLIIILGLVVGIFLLLIISVVALLLQRNILEFCAVDNSIVRLKNEIVFYEPQAMNFNQLVSLYNEMNQDIKDMGIVVNKFSFRQKYIEKVDEMVEIPVFDISSIRLTSTGCMHVYCRELDDCYSDVRQILKKIDKNLPYISEVLNQKMPLLHEVKRTVKIAKNPYINEENRENILSDVKGSYKKLAKRGFGERKIRAIKKRR